MAKSTPPAPAPRAARKAAEAVATYLVGDTPISHDGELYRPGDPIELTDRQAARLGLKLAPADAKE